MERERRARQRGTEHAEISMTVSECYDGHPFKALCWNLAMHKLILLYVSYNKHEPHESADHTHNAEKVKLPRVGGAAA